MEPILQNFADVNAQTQAAKLDGPHGIGRSKIASLVEHVVVRQQRFMHRRDDLPVTDQTRRVRNSTSRHTSFRRMTKHHAHVCRQRRSQFLDRLIARVHKPFAQQQIARRITTENQLG